MQRVKEIHENITARINYYEEIKQYSTQSLIIYVINMLLEMTYIKIRNFFIKMNANRAIKQLRITKNFVK